MKKLERRALLCLVLAGLLFVGLLVFFVRFMISGSSWAASPFNRHLYNSQGILLSGTVLDRYGEVLTTVDDEGQRVYADSSTRRKATLHVVGDLYGNIGTGAMNAFADKLTGYTLLGGAYGAEQGNELYLTIDAELNETAYQALNGRKGTVGVYNYKTGEILCLVSAPSYDPVNVPEDLESNERYEGAYLNRFLSSTFPPGSVFKTVTLAAALEELPDLEERTWSCTGSTQIGEGTVTCSKAHGEQNIQQALANSCNVVFGQLAVELGDKKLEQYTRQVGLMDSYSINGIPTAKGSFSFDTEGADNELAWAGVGQGQDRVNPCALLVYMGAIANGGKAAVPCLIQKVEQPGLPSLPQFTRQTGRLISTDIAQKLGDMMANNVQTVYGASRFPDVEVCAKSGTAEVGNGEKPHAWFAGFLRNEDAPYAFVVLVENGGSGADVAGSVAAKVLKAAVERS
ncbi:MAG: penicillin-binding transpeptidase domain-containing protein [Lawsonibacter sp.]